MRYLFCSLNNLGALAPSMGIADALRGRGHDVAFVSHLETAGLLARAGFTRIPRGDPDGASFMVKRAGDPLDVVRQVRHMERALDRFEADVIVGQMLTLGPIIAAERRGLPLAMVGAGAYLWPSSEPPADEGMRSYVLARYRGFYLGYVSAREMFGLATPASTFEDSPLLGDLFLLRSVPELEGDVEALPARVHCVGDCLWEAPGDDPALAGWLAAAEASGTPVVYAQPGRVFDRRSYWPDFIEGLGGRPVRVAASVGRLDRDAGQPPDNFFVRPHVPQSFVLPRARAVVCSATSTAVLGALTHGLPLVLLAGGGGAEQTDLIERCQRAGVAVYVPDEDVSPERLRRAALAVIEDEAMRARAERFRDLFARFCGPARAADLLEELGRRRAPILRAAMSPP
jgi:UDP:flavonoid glycosyltransferase YjiC (YdhE family)